MIAALVTSSRRSAALKSPVVGFSQITLSVSGSTPPLLFSIRQIAWSNKDVGTY
jgi:hypothetical protein